MRWATWALTAAAAWMAPGAGFALEPDPEDGLSDLRIRLKDLSREVEEDSILRAIPMPDERDRDRRGPGMGEPPRPPRVPEPPAPGRDGRRAEGRREEGARPPSPVAPPGGRGNRPDMPVMPGGAFGAAPMREGGNPAMEFEERAFRLRMRAREIEHQMQNLKFELETVRLEMEHLERTRAQGGGERGFQPRREGGWPPEARNPENLERQAAETKARLEHLRQQWNEARERGERERARDLGGAIEELQGALEEMRRGMEKGGNRPPEQDGRREEAAGAIRELEAHIEMLRDKLARAEKARDKEGAGRIREEIEKTMRRLTDLRGKDVDQKRGEVAEKAIHRLRELEERVARARSEGDKGAVKELMNEIEKVHEILRRAKGEGEKRPEKKPRMM